MAVYNVWVRWAPRHTDIVGDKTADSLADSKAQAPSMPIGAANRLTYSGLRNVERYYLRLAEYQWWGKATQRVSSR